MKKQVKLTSKSENTCKEVYEQSPDFHQCDRFCQMQCCSIRAPRRPYGQNADSWDLPVKSSPQLRAKCRFLGFARKIGPQTLFAYFHRSRSLSCIRKNPDEICNQLQINRVFTSSHIFLIIQKNIQHISFFQACTTARS